MSDYLPNRKGKGPGGGQFAPKPSIPVDPVAPPAVSMGVDGGLHTPILGSKQNAQSMITSLTEVARRNNLRFKWHTPTGRKDNLSRAELDIANNLIYLHPDLKSNPLDAAEAIVHEIAHALDPWYQQHYMSVESMDDPAYADLEVVAQAAAHLVCKKWGIQNYVRSAAYVDSWDAGSSQAIRPDLADRIRAVYKKMTD